MAKKGKRKDLVWGEKREYRVIKAIPAICRPPADSLIYRSKPGGRKLKL
jgi:hypothetical protein